MATEHDRYMDLALEQSREARKRGNWPVASVIVRDGQIVGEGANSAYSDPDATAHAEVAAIRDACRRLKTHDLAGCTLYTAMEPCPMCLWALVEANIARVVMGARHSGVGRADLGRYTVESMLEYTGRRMEIVTGVRERECTELRLDWLKTRK